MKVKVLYNIILFSILYMQCIYGQSPVKTGDLESRFLKEEIEIVPGKTFFNLFIIQNKTSKNISFNLNFALPRNWILIGELNQKFTISGNEKITVPVRVAVSKQSMGGIGYVISAAISDENKSIFETKYCYLKIPAVPQLKINTLKQLRYFSQKTNKVAFFLKIENTGNIEEYINLKIEPDLTLNIEGTDERNLVENILIKPYSDTIIKYAVKLISKKDLNEFSLHKTKLTLKGSDTLINKTIWFNYLDWKYENLIPETELPLIVDLAAHNIFNKTKPSYYARVYGSILFNNNIDLFYSLQNYNRDNKTNSLWINSRISAGIKIPKMTIFIGDYLGGFQQSMYGRGIYTNFSIGKRNVIRAAFTRGVERFNTNFGGEFTHKFEIPLNIKFGGAYTIGKGFIPDSKLMFGGLGFCLFKNNNFGLLFGASNTIYNLPSGKRSYNGYGYTFTYSGKFNDLVVKVKNRYSTDKYSGDAKGRFILNGLILYPFSEKSYLIFTYLNDRYKPSYFIGEEMFDDRFSNLEQYKLQYKYNLTNNSQLFLGPYIVNQSTNSFATYNAESVLASLTAKAEIGIRINQRSTQSSLMFAVKYAYTNIYKYSEYLNETFYPILNSKPISGFELNANINWKNAGVYILYRHGPSTIQSIYSYVYNSYFSKSFYVLPFYEKYLYKDRLKLTVRGSYIGNVSSSINLSPQLSWNVKKGWSFRFLGNFSFQKLKVDNIGRSYTSTYFEFGLKKAFYFHQPRMKYYNYNAVFYKDLNGNRIHDANEPGVSNVLAEIKRDDNFEDKDVKKLSGTFYSKELLSNSDGQIYYENMAEGNYVLNYTPQTDNLGSYIPEISKKKFTANKDTLMYVPFMEKNKVFGKVTLHRAKRSGLGAIPLDNIKIIVEGGEKTYTDLTDKDGYFELYIPVTDYYKVTINNIFYENFNIRQEYYLVKFNGYKQFEVSFDFDEKERKITGIDDSDFAIDDDGELKLEDIKVLRQTNLKGVVRDANSLKPMHATIIVTNSTTGDLISETASSLKTGAYFTNFFSGEGYILKIEAKGYWTQSEMLEINQITTFENITRDIILSPIVRGEVIEFNNQRFAASSSELSAAAKLKLENVIIRLLKNPTVKIEVQGHTDNVEALNSDAVKLSEKRAKAVISHLSSRGVEPGRMQFKGMGDRRAVANNDSQSGRARNRRVEIIVTDF